MLFIKCSKNMQHLFSDNYESMRELGLPQLPMANVELNKWRDNLHPRIKRFNNVYMSILHKLL